jgi:hypothetical protein
MHKIVPVVASVLGALLIAVSFGSAQSTSPSQGQRDSLILVFKDGHQRSFPMSEVERIEFPASPTTVSIAGQGRFLGEWRVGDCAGGYFKITLDHGGVAKKTLGAPRGTWIVVDGEARVTWEDGGRDTIRKAGDTYEKAWYAPDRSYAEDATCTASAESTERKPI